MLSESTPQMLSDQYTRLQWRTVLLGILINMMDGFDILAASFATNGLKQDWQLSEHELGWLLSSGLVGMAVGTTLNGWLADQFGRRRLVIFNLLLVFMGMVECAYATDLTVLLCGRVLAGLGIGGIITNGVVLVSEFAPAKWRSASLAIYAAGFSMGAALGGSIVGQLIPLYGWRVSFGVGALASLLMWPVLYIWLPESFEHLIIKAQTKRIEKQLKRFNLPQLPAKQSLTSIAPDHPKGGTETELTSLLNRTSVLLWVVFFLTLSGFYFLASWIPRLMTLSGLSSSQGLTTGVIQNIGGIFGSLIFALMVLNFNGKKLLCGSLFGCAAIVIVVVAMLNSQGGLVSLWVGALSLGVITNAAVTGLYAVGPLTYHPAVRATGMGVALGMGRLGAIISPAVAGWFLDLGHTPAELIQKSALAFLLAAVLMLLTIFGARKPTLT